MGGTVLICCVSESLNTIQKTVTFCNGRPVLPELWFSIVMAAFHGGKLVGLGSVPMATVPARAGEAWAESGPSRRRKMKRLIFGCNAYHIMPHWIVWYGPVEVSACKCIRGAIRAGCSVDRHLFRIQDKWEWTCNICSCMTADTVVSQQGRVRTCIVSHLHTVLAVVHGMADVTFFRDQSCFRGSQR